MLGSSAFYQWTEYPLSMYILKKWCKDISPVNKKSHQRKFFGRGKDNCFFISISLLKLEKEAMPEEIMVVGLSAC